MNTGHITLNFDEPVNIATKDFSTLKVQSGRAAGSEKILSDATTESVNGLQVVLKLSDSTLNGIKADSLLLIDQDASFITFTEILIKDMNGQAISPIVNTDAEKANQYTEDGTGCTVDSFSLDMNTGELTLTFDETVDFSEAAVTGIVLAKDASGAAASHTLRSQHSSITSTSDTTTLSVSIGVEDRNALKLKAIGLTQASTFLVMSAGLVVKDMNGKPNTALIAGTSAKAIAAPADHTVDSTKPVLVTNGVSLSLNNPSTLTLTFDEVVVNTNFDVTGLAIQLTVNDAATSYTLSAASVGTVGATGLILTVALGTTDQNEIKKSDTLAKAASSSFVTIAADAIEDASANGVAAVETSAAESVFIYGIDLQKPTLTDFDFDMSAAITLTLSFNEPVRGSALVKTAITLRTQDGAHDITLSGGDVDTTELATTIVLTLNDEDSNEIKGNTDLCFDKPTTFIIFSAGMIADRKGNLIGPITVPKQVLLHTTDTTSPTLDTFTFNIDTKTILLTFSETVKVASVTETSFTLQSGVTGGVTAPKTIQLSVATQAAAVTGSPEQIKLTLSDDDMNAVKKEADFGTLSTNTFISALASAATDVVNLPSVAVEAAAAIEADAVTPDATKPILDEYTLNINTKVLSLTFSEVVKASSLQPTKMTIQSAGTATAELRKLTGSDSKSVEDSTTLEITLNDNDMNAIKLFESVATVADGTNTFLVFESDTVRDMASLDIVALADGVDAKQADSITTDVTKPTLEEWSLNLETETVKLTFSEAMESTAVETKIQFHADSDFNNAQGVSYSLTDAAVTDRSADGLIITIKFEHDDTEKIKQLDLCSEEADCYLRVSADLIQDMANNPVVASVDTDLTIASDFIEDATPPTLTSFHSFNMDTGTIVLRFSESVKSFNTAVLELHDHFTSSATSYTLEEAATVTGEDTQEITIKMHEDDLNAIKTTDSICQSTTSCYVRFTNLLAIDLSSTANKVVAVESSTDLTSEERKAEANTVTHDQTGPALEEFTLNINTGELKLTFDEPVNFAEFVPASNIVFQSNGNGVDSYSVTVSTSRDLSIQTFRSKVMPLTLSTSDLLKIKAQTNLATNAATTWITISTSLVKDMSPARANGNLNQAIQASAAQQTADYTADSTNPKLVTFDEFDNNDGTFTITFDDAMAITPIDHTKIKFTNVAGDDEYQLQHAATSATWKDNVYRTTIVFKMNILDLTAIRLKPGILASEATSLINLEAGAFQDLVQLANDATSAAEEAEEFVVDTVPPELENYHLDVNAGKLYLTFNDVVKPDTLLTTDLVFSSQLGNDDTRYRLTGGTPASTPVEGSFEVTVTITANDLNALKIITAMATTTANTFIYFSVKMIKDVSGQDIIGVSSTNAKQATKVTVDTTNPTLDDYVLDMDKRELTMTFSEALNSAEFDITALTLQHVADDAGEGVQLGAVAADKIKFTDEDDDALTNFQTVVVATISDASFNAITAKVALATEKDDTFLSITAAAVSDMAALTVDVIESTAAKGATSYIEDNTDPTVTDFTLDLDTKTASVTFSETVNVNLADLTKITLQLPSATTPDFTLTGGTKLATAPSTVLSFSLDDDDVDAIKLTVGLAKSEATSAIRVATDFAIDMAISANTVEVVEGASPVDCSDFVADDTEVELTFFSFNLNSGQLKLTFNEPIIASSFTPGAFRLQSGADSATDLHSHQLTSATAPVDGAVNGKELTVQLSDDDLNAIKLLTLLAISDSSTYLVASLNGVTDIAGKGLTPIVSTAAKLNTAAGWVFDSTAPKLTGLAVNMNLGTISLNFNEPIKADSLEGSLITVQSNKAATPDHEFDLSDASTESINGLQLVIKLKTVDLNTIKKNLALYTGTSDSAVRLSAGAFDDMASVAIQDISAADAIVATSHVPDTSGPQLSGFDLNMNTRHVTLTFTETMDKDTLAHSKITLQTSSDAKASFQTTFDQTDSATITAEDATVIVFSFSLADANQLSFRLIGTSEAKTWMVLEKGAMDDTSGQESVARVNGADAVRVSSLVQDNQKPELSTWDLNMNSGVLSLYFSEAVDDTSFVTTGITLIAAKGAATNLQYTLAETIHCNLCANSEYETKACTADSQTECAACLECTADQYYTVGCGDTTNSECSACSTCGANEFVAAPCAGFSDLICTTCTAACPDNTYKIDDCSASADLNCGECTQCGVDQFMVTGCTATANTVCQDHKTTCETGEYMSKTGTASSDIECSSCATCGTDEFVARACSATTNTVCASCSTPEANFEWISDACTTTTNAEIDVCDTCNHGEFASTVCAGLNNAACTTCSTCAAKTYADARCTLDDDTVCNDCTDNCANCAMSNACTVCENGYMLTDEHLCVLECPAGSFDDGLGGCDACHGSCGTCSGSTAAECTSCRSEPVAFTQFGTLPPAGSGRCSHSCVDATNTGFPEIQPTGDIQCAQCDPTSNCKTCYGSGEDQCLSCKGEQVMAEHTCVDECPDQWFGPNNDGYCDRCPADCKTCSSASVCTECTNGSYLIGGVCHQVVQDPKKYGSGGSGL